MEIISENKMFEGVQGVYRHNSSTLKCEMTFAVFMPSLLKDKKIPVLWFLSGLTCTHENAMLKAGAQKFAQEHNIAVIFPDTSPRGTNIPDDDAYDLGQGAGFYLNATQSPWKENYKMWDYLVLELPSLIEKNFSVNTSKQSVMGHSMGGHGALLMALRLNNQFKSVSAFAPICNPMKSDWGRKQFSAYLGSEESLWENYDASVIAQKTNFLGPILIDTGSNDQFLNLLLVDSLSKALKKRGLTANFRMNDGYDHSYYFIATFMEEHINFHAAALSKNLT